MTFSVAVWFMRGRERTQGEDVAASRAIQPGNARLAPKSGESGWPRQRLVNHAGRSRARHGRLTRVLKPITTGLWHSRDNRAATARREPSFEASNGSRQDCCRVEPRIAARPV